MLLSVFVTTAKGGTVIFNKEWVKFVDKSINRMLGGLLTTIQEFSRQATGMGVRYMEFENVAVSMVTDDRLICSLFHESQDGVEFGCLIAREILTTFITEYGDNGFTDFDGVLNVNQHYHFHTKLGDAITGSVQTILATLKRTKGIQYTLLVLADGSMYSSGTIDHQLSLVANVQALLTFSNEMVLYHGSETQLISLTMSRQMVYVRPIHDSFLVVVCKRSFSKDSHITAINSSVALLGKVLNLLNNLSGMKK